jgi:hypothetical protein
MSPAGHLLLAFLFFVFLFFFLIALAIAVTTLIVFFVIHNRPRPASPFRQLKGTQ